MKSISKLFRIVAVATILSLLVLALPTSPALAAEDIKLDPDDGEIGEYIDIDGDGFNESTATDDYYVDIYFSSEEADEGDDIDDEVENYERVKSGYWVDEDGEFSTSFKVPKELADGDKDEDVTGGTYYVYVTYEDKENIEAVDTFTVIAAEITLDPDEGAVGTEVEITGIDFNDNEDITVELDGAEVDIEDGDTDTNSNGEFTCTIIIPESTAGEHTITVTDESDVVAEATLTVEPEITVNPTTGAAGDTVTVEGTGFGKNADVSIEFDGDEVATDEVDVDGSFQVTFTLPVKGPGTYDIEAEDDDKNKDKADFTIAAGLKLSQTTGNVGTEATISGTGFQPNANVNISYAAGTVATTTADANGKFSATFTVPKSKAGSHTITASDGTNTETTTFTMESTPPPVPAPELPLDTEKAKSPVRFDWGDVTDPSGVTYALQIATDDKFTAASIVVEEPELAESEYTLTKEERLKSTKQEAPYYWRVQAVDGAANESGWTTPGSFFVGFAFGFTGWVLYVLMGIAGLLLLAIGYLLGKRAAFY